MQTILILDVCFHRGRHGVNAACSDVVVVARVLQMPQDVLPAVLLAMSGWISFTNYKSQLNNHTT
jgi:hypothetical protein